MDTAAAMPFDQAAAALLNQCAMDIAAWRHTAERVTQTNEPYRWICLLRVTARLEQFDAESLALAEQYRDVLDVLEECEIRKEEAINGAR